YECPPEIEMVALNAVRARHAADVEAPERPRPDNGQPGTSNGQAGQVFRLDDLSFAQHRHGERAPRNTPVVPGSTLLQIGEDEVFSSADKPSEVVNLCNPAGETGPHIVRVAGVAWSEVSDLETAGPNDLAFQFDCARGRIQLGDGIHGRIPPQGDDAIR